MYEIREELCRSLEERGALGVQRLDHAGLLSQFEEGGPGS